MPAPLRRRRLMAEINVVPYIDVMLVLLIIFMITAPLLKEGVKVDLPDAGAKPLDADLLAKHQPLVVTIDARGRLYINFGQNQDQPVSEATVSARTAALLRRDPQTPVLVQADTTVAYGTVVRAMVLLQQAGATKVGFLTDPVRTKPPARVEPNGAASGVR
jgi:biopolymer transport protein TolR